MSGCPHEEVVVNECPAAHRLRFDLQEGIGMAEPHGEDIGLPIANERASHNQGVDIMTTPNVKVGMVFESMEKAYKFYNVHAKKVGFGIRKQWMNKNKYGIVRSRKLCCSSEGNKKKKKLDENVTKHCDSWRSDCKAHIVVNLGDTGKYVITKVELNHNHHCTPKKAFMFRCRRNISPLQAIESGLANRVGIRPKATYDLMCEQAGGPEHVGFLHRDHNNFLRTKGMSSMKMGDAGGVLEYLRKKATEDPGFVSVIEVDLEDQITNIFWTVVLGYQLFGDVLCFDTTHRTNSYGRPFAPFVGLNHHRQTIVFGAALMYDETTQSFEWVFRSFLEAMSNQKPMTILTNQDKAMANAISSVMPNTHHRICLRHMYQNALKHLHRVFSASKTFNADFSKCIYEYDNEIEFLSGWEAMLDKYALRGNEWLQQLFSEREVGYCLWQKHILRRHAKHAKK